MDACWRRIGRKSIGLFPSVGAIKQSRDVKALVLISPQRILKGVPLDPALKDANIMNLPMMIVASTGGPEAKDTRRIAKTIENQKKATWRRDCQRVLHANEKDIAQWPRIDRARQIDFIGDREVYQGARANYG